MYSTPVANDPWTGNQGIEQQLNPQLNLNQLNKGSMKRQWTGEGHLGLITARVVRFVVCGVHVCTHENTQLQGQQTYKEGV